MSGKKMVPVPEKIAPLLRRIGRLAASRGHRAYAVGGCVRDWLLGATKATTPAGALMAGRARLVDVDVCVEGDGIALARAAAGLLHADLTVHEQFGTATLQAAHGRLDIAGCRRETYREPAAYPKVAPGSLRDDLFRRDFTVNAMAMRLSPNEFGRLIDEFGGLRDLRARRLRVLHSKSFVDDPSRILRAARFGPRFGMTLERGTAGLLREAVAAGMLSRLNRGRIRKELAQMLAEPHPASCLAQVGAWAS